jgi:glucokinase
MKNHEVHLQKANEQVINSRVADVFDISEAANFGDEVAIKCLLQVGFYLGISVASFANIFDIPNFIIGGGVSQSDLILEQTEKIAKERALPTVAKYLKIERAKYLNETGIIGAALMGKKNIFK